MGLDGNNKEPREHHYLFVHRLLPMLFYEEPLTFIAVCNTKGNEFLTDMWQKLGKEHIENAEHRMPPVGLRAVPVEEPPILGTLVVLPNPRGITEAYMVLAVGTFRKRLFRKPILQKPRYFTLEYNPNDKDEDISMLCSWSKDGGHTNYGDGPPPNQRAFIEACRKLM